MKVTGYILKRGRVALLLLAVILLFVYLFVNNFASKSKATVTVSERTIVTASSHTRENLDMSANYIVWEDNTDTTNQVYVYNIATGVAEAITTAATYATKPSVDGTKVVYKGCSGLNNTGNCDVYMYDISTETETAITTLHGVDYPRISGNNIVWQDERDFDEEHPADYNIYRYNLTAETEYAISENTYAQKNPDIHGDRVVFEDNRNGNWDIYTYEIPSEIHTFINTNAASQLNPSVYGDKVAYQSYQHGNWDIFVYDMSDSSTTRITTDSTAQENPAIYGNRVVYTDARDGGINIYMYDLTTGEESQISSSKYGESGEAPAFYGNYVAWADLRSGVYDIYLGTLTDQYTPTFVNLPDTLSPINVVAGQVITTNPFILKVKPSDSSGIKKVDFYIDANLICTATTADASGIYSCSWDTSKYHSDVRVVVTNNQDRTAELSVYTTVDPALYMTVLPVTGGE